MKNPILALLLTSTAIVVVATGAGAQLARQADALKPSVEVHLDALDSLEGTTPAQAPAQAAAAPAPAPVPVQQNMAPAPAPVSAAPVYAPAPQPQTITATRVIVPLSKTRTYETRKPVNNSRLALRDSNGRDVPRHGSVLLNSRLQPLAPAPVGSVRPIPKQPQIMHIAPPYGAKIQAAPAAVFQPPVVAEQAPAPVEIPVEQDNVATQEIPAPAPVEVPAPVVAEAPPVEQPAPMAEQEQESSWWDDTTDAVGGLFDADETSNAENNAAPAEEERKAINTPVAAEEAKAPTPINIANTTGAQTPVAGEQPLSAPPAEIQNAEREPVQYIPAPEADEAPAHAAVPETARPANNAASYDGLEMAEEFSAHMPMTALSAPPAAIMQPAPAAEVPLPVPVVREGEEVVLGQASDSAEPAGLVDPFQDGSHIVAQSAFQQPIPPIVEPAPVAEQTAEQPAPAPEPVQQAIAPEPAPVQAAAATPAKEDSSWMSDLQDSLTGYFEEDKAAPAPAPASPIVSEADQLKLDELRAVPTEPVATTELAAPAPAPAEAVVEAPAPVEAPVPVVVVEPAPKPVVPQEVAAAEPEEAPAKSPDHEMEAMVGLGELKPMPENPTIPAVAQAPEPVVMAEAKAPELPKLPVAKNEASANATPSKSPENLPSLTKLTGDPEVMRETETRRVASADIPPPSDRKPVPQAPDAANMERRAPEGNPPMSAEQLVKDVPIIPAAPIAPTPAPQAPEVTISAKAPEPKPEVKAEAKAEIKKEEPKPEVKEEAKTTPKEASAEKAAKKEEALKAPIEEKKPEAVMAENKKPDAVAAQETKPETPAAADKKPEEKAPATVTIAADALEGAPAEAAEDKAKEVELKRDEPMAVASLPEKEKMPATSNAAANISLNFTGDDKTLPKDGESQMKEIAETLKGQDKARVNLKAYATGEDDAKAKRVALSRGLAVRNYLIDQGVNPLRINLLSFGNKNAGGNPERVDVELIMVGGV